MTNPVIDTSFPTDVPNAVKCADPFIVQNNGTYYMFFEVAYTDGITPYIEVDNEACWATSADGLTWTYGGIVEGIGAGNYNQVMRLDNSNGDFIGWYMAPNLGDSTVVDLYVCLAFPDLWVRFRRLLTDPVAVRDASIFYYGGYWYVHYGSFGADYCERLWVSDDLLHGTFTEHPSSPILTGDDQYRGAGRPIVHPGVGVDIFVQKNDVVYGEATRGFRLTNLTPTTCTVTELATSPLITASGVADSWNEDGMHTLDRVNSGLTVVDGRRIVGETSSVAIVQIGIYRDVPPE